LSNHCASHNVRLSNQTKTPAITSETFKRSEQQNRLPAERNERGGVKSTLFYYIVVQRCLILTAFRASQYVAVSKLFPCSSFLFVVWVSACPGDFAIALCHKTTRYPSEQTHTFHKRAYHINTHRLCNSTIRVNERMMYAAFERDACEQCTHGRRRDKPSLRDRRHTPVCEGFDGRHSLHFQRRPARLQRRRGSSSRSTMQGAGVG
jgi:hypothetical protein